MEQIKIIDSDSVTNFEEEVNGLLEEGWELSSSSCGFINSEEYSFKDFYQAILIRRLSEVKINELAKQLEDEKEFWEAMRNQEPYSDHLKK
jgi:hypothetical protein